MEIHTDLVKTERLTVRPMSHGEMQELVKQYKNADPELGKAYQEMLDGCVAHPQEYLWYTAWKICLNETDAAIGDVCFKGFHPEGWVEIGYGVNAGYEGHGYATETVIGMCRWAFAQPGVVKIEAETAPDNQDSQRVLAKSGFHSTGELGEEGPRFALYKGENQGRCL